MKKALLILIGCSIAVICTAVIIWQHSFWFKRTIKIGLLHSQTGPMAINEQRLLNAELMAIDEINAQGGIHGRKLQPIIANGASDELTFEKEALRLITQEKVEVLVGCWLSAGRKRVKDVVEKYNNLLLYPVNYEGLEESHNIMYSGATPNQYIIPGVTWCFNNVGKRFFLIGTDSLISHALHKIIEMHVLALDGEIVGQQYIKVNEKITGNHIQKILESNPEMIINTINGDTNISFFRELLQAGISSEQVPTMSVRMSQADFDQFELKSIIGAYVLFNYAAESQYPFNIRFIENYKKRYGKDARIGESGQSAYSIVHMWAQAYQQAESSKPEDIIPIMKRLTYQSPSGIIYFAENQNCWQDSIISKLAYNGDLMPIWKSVGNIRPEIYPAYLTKNEWNDFLTSLYEGWGKRWSAP
ncbi:transporter substrate-binding protein [Candidatus Dependentiae bacterium]|nr:transporter substrate-binding protein [Candidatus Dependentiae bacterium]